MIAIAAVWMGFVLSWVHARRVHPQFDQLRGLAHYLIFDAYDGISKFSGSTALSKNVVGEAQAYLDDNLVRPGATATLSITIELNRFAHDLQRFDP